MSISMATRGAAGGEALSNVHNRHRPFLDLNTSTTGDEKNPYGGDPMARHNARDDGYSLDNFYLARPGADEVQLDLFGDYKSNVALYPEFQAYFRKHKPPFLAAWGKNDPFFLPPGAEAFKRDIPDADVRFFDTGHFALEPHCDEIAVAIRNFLSRSK